MPATRQHLGCPWGTRRSSACWSAQALRTRLSATSRSGRRLVADGSSCKRADHVAGALAIALGGFTLIGCGSGMPSLDTTRVEHSIAASILAQHHIAVPVTCPSKVPLEVGRAFECKARLQVGTYPVGAIEVNASGRVRYANQAPLVVLNVAAVKRAIAQSTVAHRYAPAVVTCPTQVLQKQGIFFTCSATSSSSRGSLKFNVTVVDDNGHVRYTEASR